MITPKRARRHSKSAIQSSNILLRSNRLTVIPRHLILKWSYIDMGRKTKAARSQAALASHTLADLPTGQRCILDRLDLPEDIARRLMELGFLPGNEIVPGRRAPGGGPRVFRVDGSEVALRDDTAARLYVRRDPESDLIVLS
jgi:ferrous iron transport protein A